MAKEDERVSQMNHDALAAIVFLIFALVMTFESIKLGLGSIHDPGPGFLPIFSAMAKEAIFLGKNPFLLR